MDCHLLRGSWNLLWDMETKVKVFFMPKPTTLFMDGVLRISDLRSYGWDVLNY